LLTSQSASPERSPSPTKHFDRNATVDQVIKSEGKRIHSRSPSPSPEARSRSPRGSSSTSPRRRRSKSPRRKSVSGSRSPHRRRSHSPRRRRKSSSSPHRRSPARRGSRSPKRSPDRKRKRSRSRSRDVDRKRPRGDTRSLYVGNLPYDIRKDELKQLCSKYGEVYRVTLGARGFGFVLMEARGARRAMEALDRRTFGGRILHVNDAFREDKT